MMKSKIINSVASLFVIVIFAFISLTSVQAYDLLDKGGASKTANQAGYPVASQQEAGFLPQKIGQVIGAVLSFIGALFLILMIYAGYLWMTARGNEQQITKAKGLMYNAVVGLIIILGAYAITAFVGRQLAPTTTGG